MLQNPPGSCSEEFSLIPAPKWKFKLKTVDKVRKNINIIINYNILHVCYYIKPMQHYVSYHSEKLLILQYVDFLILLRILWLGVLRQKY